MNRVRIEGGIVRLGLTPGQFNRLARDYPELGPEWLRGAGAAELRLRDYWLSPRPVTCAEFRDFLQVEGNGTSDGVSWYWEGHPYGLLRLGESGWAVEAGLEDHPISGISLAGARAYAGWRQARLPTAAEWEHAARAGSTTLWPWGDDGPADQCNHFDLTDPTTLARQVPLNDGRGPTPVDTFPANAWGLSDMLGNVWEWCEGDKRAELRGGSWNDILPLAFLPAFAHPCPADYPVTYTWGLRLAWDGSAGPSTPAPQARAQEPIRSSVERLEALRQVRRRLLARVFVASEEALLTSPGPPLWPAIRILGHLAEAEEHFVAEVRAAVAAPAVALLPCAFSEPKKARSDSVLALLAGVRARTEALLAALPDVAWAAPLPHSSHPLLAGRSVAEAVDFLLWHEARHAQQIDELVARVEIGK